jgi:hypothetical protein
MDWWRNIIDTAQLVTGPGAVVMAWATVKQSTATIEAFKDERGYHSWLAEMLTKRSIKPFRIARTEPGTTDAERRYFDRALVERRLEAFGDGEFRFIVRNLNDPK